MSSRTNQTLLVVAYGSLLSGYGILATRRGGGSKLIARDAFPVTLANARRGLAKPSSHGHYLAMDLEPIVKGQPLTADPDNHAGEGIGVLGLEFDRAWAPLIARREEYDSAKFLELIDLADRSGQSLGEFLLTIAEATHFDLLAYRTRLREMVDYTSHGYIFHPIPFEDGRIGIAAIGSGFEGSGDPAIRSKRREFGMDRLLPLPAALKVATFDLDRSGQVGYFVECLLGGCHGLGVADLIGELDADPALMAEVVARLAAVTPLERALFQQATSLDEARYRQRFNGQLAAPLKPFFSAEG